MLLCGFLGRHKLLWSGPEELKLLLALDTAGGVVGPAGALDNVHAFLRWALRISHLTRQGHIPNALFVFKKGAQAPNAPHSCWKILLWDLLYAVLTQFLAVCSSEGALEGFSPFLAHMGTGRASDGRWKVELDVQGEAWLAVGSHPVPPVQPGGWGTPWAKCPLTAQIPPLAWPGPHSRTFLLSLSTGHGQGFQHGH